LLIIIFDAIIMAEKLIPHYEKQRTAHKKDHFHLK
jgi:hypothetical protein